MLASKFKGSDTSGNRGTIRLELFEDKLGGLPVQVSHATLGAAAAEWEGSMVLAGEAADKAVKPKKIARRQQAARGAELRQQQQLGSTRMFVGSRGAGPN